MNIPLVLGDCGLYLKLALALGRIGIQGNPFTPVYVRNHYSNWSTGGPAAATNSGTFGNHFIVDILAGTGDYNPTVALNFGGPTQIIFNNVGTGGTYKGNCAAPLVLHHALVPTTYEALSLISDTVPYEGFIETSRWYAHYSMYHYLHAVDTANLVDSNNAIKNYVDSVKYGNIGAIDSANQLMSDTNGISPSKYQTAKRLALSLTNPDTAETYLLSYYSILFNIYDSGLSEPANPQQISDLQTLATLCPDQYGPAVYMARALLAPIDDIDYSNPCEEIPGSNDFRTHRKQGDSPIITQNLSALVYPNPANTVLNIELLQQGQPAILNGSVEHFYIYNQLGELILTMQLSNNLTKIPVNQLSQGIYHYVIIDEKENRIKADNLLIVR